MLFRSRMMTETIVSRLATLAGKMPAWNHETLDRFVEAEAALVAKQLTAPRGKDAVWTAWRNVGVMRDYGMLLAEERFDEIRDAVARL